MKTLPRYNLVHPEGGDLARDLPAHIEAMARSIMAALDSFNYHGADPNLVLSRVAALEHMPNVLTRTGPAQHEVTPTAWGELPITADQPLVIDCATAEWWEFTYTHWSTLAGTGNLRTGIQCTGATSIAPEHPSWSNCTYTTATGGISQAATKTVRLNPGQTQVRVVGFRNGAVTSARSNYGHLTATRLGLA